jgi:hypothetical protein
MTILPLKESIVLFFLRAIQLVNYFNYFNP